MQYLLYPVYLSGLPPYATASLYSSDNIMPALGAALIIGFVIAISLISMSRTKMKATKADKYISSKLILNEKSDVYTHTTTTKQSTGNSGNK